MTDKSRPGTKIDDQLIARTQHEALHFSGATDKTAWPQMLGVTVNFIDTDIGMVGTVDVDLNYRILDAALGASLCTMGDCHERINETTGLCA